MSRVEVTVERRGRVATLRYSADLDRLRVEGLARLRRALDDVTADPELRVVVLSGAPGRFPRMMDPSEGLALAASAPPLPGWLAARLLRFAVATFRALPSARTLLDHPRAHAPGALVNQRLLAEGLSAGRAVTVAALEGPVFGGGLELALACDLRVVSDATDSWLAQPEILGDVMVGFGAAERLARVVGEARALELLLTGRPLDPATALAWGLVNRVFPAASFRDELQAFTDALASRSKASLTGTIRAVRAAAGRAPARAREVELAEMAAVWRTPEATAGLRRVADAVAALPLDQPLPPLPELLESLVGPVAARAARRADAHSG